MFFRLIERIDHMSTDDEKCRQRKIMLVTLDFIICILSFLFSRVLLELEIVSKTLIPVFVYAGIDLVCLLKLRCYDSLWNCGGEKEAARIFEANIIALLPGFIAVYLITKETNLAFYVLNLLMIIVAMIFVRVVYRTMRRIVQAIRFTQCEAEMKKVLIIGAGVVGNLIIRELYTNQSLKMMPVAVVDDDIQKIGMSVYDVPVMGTTEDIERIVNEQNIDEIIFSIAKIGGKRRSEIVDKCTKTGCRVKTVPGFGEILEGKVNVTTIRDININDLLGREPIIMSLSDIEIIENKTIMVTGGGGSIGSELCRQIAQFNPKQLIIVDIYENNAYDIQQELVRSYPKLNLKVLIASVRDRDKLETIFMEYNPEVVFHAAAHKHVPLMEDSPCEAIKNNVFGTENVAQLSDKYKVKKFVLISTDKAVNPTNIMGATKRCCEMIVQTINKHSETEFVAVRFGNVLGSNGSVVPLFRKQIEDGGPVTVTHEEVTRFFMTIPEAVSLVLQASAMAKGGEIFVLDMGEPVKIMDLAYNLIKESGLTPHKDIEIKITGLRPGEKLYEEVLMDEEGLTTTANKKIKIGKPIELDEKEFKKELAILRKVAYNNQNEKVDLIMKSIVPTYIKQEKVI